ncbi:LANO_0G16490g1_1 [Lachancea nothofagi CBS 11611]|uniref:LANO_0G16490g1_1 n=1 Tax=Lachancea nothofagi CBS 11611 TaxID=1266666 RepID=A0A1G4KKK8_9SACH|nr:LANO_0G16490g1_1 [Lachancea nothofagi CBS 11611]
MSNAERESTIEPNLVITELRAPEKFITGSLLDDERLLVVKDRELLIFTFPVATDVPILKFVTQARVLAVWTCQDLVSSSKYTLFLYSSGVIEARNSQLEILDTVRVGGFGHITQKPLVVTDTEFNRFFITWDRLSISRVDYHIGPSKFKLLVSKNRLKEAFKCQYPIVSLCACRNTSEDLQEVYNMCVISQSRNSDNPCLEVWEELDMIRSKWQPIIKSKCLTLQNKYSAEVSLVARSNFGFICVIDGQSIVCNTQKYYQTQRPQLDILEIGPESYSDFKCLEYRVLFSSKQLLGAESDILGCTSSGHFFRLNFNPSSNQIDMVKYLPLNFSHIRKGNSDLIESFMLLKDCTYLISTSSQEILLLNLDGSSLINKFTITCQKSAVLHSSISGGGGNFSRLLISGGSLGNRGFLDSTHLGFEESLRLEAVAETIAQNVFDFWLTEHGIYWVDVKGSLFDEKGLLEAENNPLCVNYKGEVILRSKEIFMIEPIRGSTNEEFMSIDEQGMITWSSTNLRAKIPDFANVATVKYHISSAKLPNNTILSVVAWNARSIWFFDADSISIHLQGLTQISSCLVKVSQSCTTVIFADVMGNVHVYNIGGTLRSQLKVDGHRISLHDFPFSEKFFATCLDSIFLVGINNNELDAAEITMPIRMKHMKVVSASKIFLLGNDSALYEADITKFVHARQQLIKKSLESHLYIITKHLTLQKSRRFVITSALANNFDKAREKTIYDSELQVYDVALGQLVNRYSITSLFPQAIISDLIGVPFKKDVMWNKYLDTETSFAKQLIFAKCFLVSLNFEFAEDELEENVLLFTLDEVTGEIELQLKTRLNFNVTSLLNYSNRIIFALGDSVQAFQLGYSAKEGSFSLKQISKALNLDGYISGCFPFPPLDSLLATSGQKKRQKLNDLREIIGVHNIFKGIQQIEIRGEVSAHASTEVLSSNLKEISLKHLPISECEELAKPFIETRFLSCAQFGFDEDGGNVTATYSAAMNDEGRLSVIYEFSNSLEPLSIARFEISHQITSIGLVKISPKGEFSNKAYGKDACSRTDFKPMFLLNATDGSCYLVSAITSAKTLKRFEDAAIRSDNDSVSLVDSDAFQLFDANHKLAGDVRYCLFG